MGWTDYLKPKKHDLTGTVGKIDAYLDAGISRGQGGQKKKDYSANYAISGNNTPAGRVVSADQRKPSGSRRGLGGDSSGVTKSLSSEAGGASGVAPVQAPASRGPRLSERLQDITSRDSPLMRGARTRGKQESNRRGLLNSSMGVQASEAAAYDVALPIASQESSEDLQSYLTTRGQNLDYQISTMNIAANDREKAGNLAAGFQNTYSQMYSNIMQNPEIPAKARQGYIDHVGRIRDDNFNLLEQLYSVDLRWSTPALT